MSYKACPKCGRIHPYNYRCTKGIVYKGGVERQLRSQYKWAVKSRQIREKANYLCEVCKDHNVYTYNNLEVHHIDKLKDNQEKLLDDYNLICLCVEHHKQADRGLIDKDYLLKLAGSREDNY